MNSCCGRENWFSLGILPLSGCPCPVDVSTPCTCRQHEADPVYLLKTNKREVGKEGGIGKELERSEWEGRFDFKKFKNMHV